MKNGIWDGKYDSGDLKVGYGRRGPDGGGGAWPAARLADLHVYAVGRPSARFSRVRLRVSDVTRAGPPH